MIHFAKFKNSKRLQDVHKILEDGKPHSGFEIQEATESMAVHTDISELRANGFTINQFYGGRTEKGRLISIYQLESVR